MLLYLKRIRDLREDNDLKQKELADYLNISQQYYSNIEKGERTISAEIVKQLSLFYNVSSDYLLEITDNKEINK
jgi:bacteriophage CI repressor helix-turn-helix domain